MTTHGNLFQMTVALSVFLMPGSISSRNGSAYGNRSASTTSPSAANTGARSASNSLGRRTATTAGAQNDFRGYGIRYVGPAGNDGDEGNTWQTAKLTVDAALCSLPGGSCTPPLRTGAGTVYFVSGVHACAADSSDGIMLMGRADPNYGAPPKCWLHEDLNAGQGVAIIGIGAVNGGNNSHAPRAAIIQSNDANGDRNKPTLWLSAVSGPVFVKNLSTGGYPGRGVVVGECSNNARTGVCGDSGISFENDSFTVQNASGDGPSWDLAAYNFWIFIRDSGGTGTGVVNGVFSNRSPALLMDGTGAIGNGLIQIQNFNAQGNAGIKYIPGSTPGSFDINQVTVEGDFHNACAPGVEMTGTAGGAYRINNVTMADCGGAPKAVQVDSANSPNDVAVGGMYSSVSGPLTLINSASTNVASDPISQQETGFHLNRVIGQTDVARRNFPPVAVLKPNLAWSPGGWRNLGSARIRSEVANDPIGGNNALRVSSSSGTSSMAAFDANARHVVGDWLIAAAWVRAPSGQFAGNVPLSVAFIGGCSAKISVNGPMGVGTGSGNARVTLPVVPTNWYWAYAYIKIGSLPGGNACEDRVSVNADPAHPTDIYGLVVNEVQSGTWDDQTVLDYVSHLSSYDPSCEVGTECGMRDQTLVGYTFKGPAIVASRYATENNCSSTTGACGSASAGAVIIRQGASSVTVQTTAVTADSDISLTFNSAVGKRLGVTCSATPQQPYVTRITPGTSFVLSIPTSSRGNPSCFTYEIKN